jgi:aminopeptidase N
MSLRDPLLHPALIDPRQWGEINLFEYAFNPDRSPVEGEEHQTPDLPFRIEHLELDLRFVKATKSISGSASYRLTPVNPGLGEIRLDASELEISSITLTSESSTPLAWETFRDSIVIRLDRSYDRGEQISLKILYAGRPRKGLFFIQPDQSYPDKPTQIWSQGENEDAHWWFPCLDVTHQKMTTVLKATVDREFVAVSNGYLVETLNNDDGTQTFHWRLDQPHPAYLVSVVIGRYEVVRDVSGGVPLEYYLYPERITEGRRLFAHTPQMIEFFSRKFGVDYPYPKYSQALVDDFLFGAMENTSATTMTDRCLLDERAALDVNYDDIVAHELAHQWWGDLVTCKDWTQIWLNESFATYSEYLWREETEGADNARWSLFQDYLVYLREDLTSHRRPLVCRKYRFSEELMDRHAYEKGACILHMLRGILGDEQFFRSLGHYLRKHAHQAAETHDFKVAIEEATGRNLHWFFDQWIWNAGYPELEIRRHWDSGQLQLTIRQLQALNGDGQVFRLPVEIEATLADGSRLTWQVEITRAEQEIFLACPNRPVMVLFDKGERIFKLLHFEKSLDELLLQLRSAGELMDRVRAARELASWKCSRSIEALAAILNGEDHPGVRMAAATSLGEIGGDVSREILLTACRTIDLPAVRRTCLLALGQVGDIRDIPLYRETIDSSPSYFAAVAAVRCLASLATRDATGEAFDTLQQTIERRSWQEVIAAAVFHGFNHARERRATDLALRHSEYGQPLPIRLAAIGCLATLGLEYRKEEKSPEAEKIYQRLVDLLADPNHRARTAAIRALGKVGNRAALPKLHLLKNEECLDMIRGALLDAITKLEQPPKS